MGLSGINKVLSYPILNATPTPLEDKRITDGILLRTGKSVDDVGTSRQILLMVLNVI